ncbi:unnamed protein product [Wuchereria bancrofti]|uniref:Uncharacterized protein n=1 Tax=Wuchereria bancrofti TaxID=6293 RepID=A0A3P7DS39_WUCBA|nr:unnamed protein product [Wuchereria bancrofti]
MAHIARPMAHIARLILLRFLCKRSTHPSFVTSSNTFEEGSVRGVKR